MGIDPGVTWRQASTLDYKVNQLIFNNGTQGLLAACRWPTAPSQNRNITFQCPSDFCLHSGSGLSVVRQQVPRLRGATGGTGCRFYLLSQGNTDFKNCVYYVHLYKHLEFICSVAFEGDSSPCI